MERMSRLVVLSGGLMWMRSQASEVMGWDGKVALAGDLLGIH